MTPVQIKLKAGATPCKAALFRRNLAADTILQQLMQPLLASGIVRKSKSPWRTNSFLVDKKLPENLDTTGMTAEELTLKRYRMVHDMREVNKRIEDDTYALPRIDQLKEKVLNSKFFSKLDARSGYLQIKLTEDSIPIMSVYCGGLQVEYTTLVFGCKTSPALYQRAMEELLDEFINGPDPFVFQFIDDTLIFSRTEEEHVQHMTLVLERLQAVDLQLNREKCLFGAKTVRYLGHMIGNNQVIPDPLRIKPIVDMPVPTDKTALRAFIGAINQFKEFCPNLRSILRPLDRMTSMDKKVKLEWNDPEREAFEEAKKVLLSAPCLTIYDPSKEHILDADASDHALGGVLRQVDVDPLTGKNVESVVEFHSRAFNSAERNYTTTEKELLAIVDCLKHWRPYLALKHFTIRSDHHAICVAARLGKTKRTIPDHQRLARWSWVLQDYQYTLTHVKGKNHVLADCLSRNIFPKVNLQSLIEQEIELSGANPFNSIHERTYHSYQPLQYLLALQFGQKFEKLREAQREDKWISRIIELLTIGGPDLEEFERNQKMAHSTMVIVDGILCNQIKKKLFKLDTREPGDPEPAICPAALPTAPPDSDTPASHCTFTRIVVPEQFVWNVLQLCHDAPTAGHLGVKRTLDRVALQFYWHGWHQDVLDFVRSCEKCQRRNPKNRNEGLLQSQAKTLPEEVIEPFHWIVMDQIEIPSVKTRGFGYILLAIDLTSKWLFLKPVESLSAQQVISFVQSEILKMGHPQKIVTDNAKYFTAKKFQDFCAREHIDLRHGVARYPEVQGLAEKNVGTVKTMLSKFIAEDTDWPSKVPDFTISYNTSTHSATGFSPFYHVFGRHYLSSALGTIPIPTFPPLETMNETAVQFRSRMRDLWRASFQANLSFNTRTLEQANTRRTPFQLEVGMKVLKRVSPEKVQAGIIRSIYDDGPYQITRVFGPTSFEAVHLITGEVTKSNIHQCKKYHLRSEIPRLQLLRQRNLNASFSSHLTDFLENFPSNVYATSSLLGGQ